MIKTENFEKDFATAVRHITGSGTGEALAFHRGSARRDWGRVWDDFIEMLCILEDDYAAARFTDPRIAREIPLALSVAHRAIIAQHPAGGEAARAYALAA